MTPKDPRSDGIESVRTASQIELTTAFLFEDPPISVIPRMCG